MYTVSIQHLEEIETYDFTSNKEAQAFIDGFLASQASSDDPSPEIKIVAWPAGAREPAPSPWMALLFSVFIGGWSSFWWHIFNRSEVAIEYLIVGLVSALGSYIILLIFGWIKKKRKSAIID